MTKPEIKLQRGHLAAAQLPEHTTLAEYTVLIQARLVEARTLGWMIKDEYLVPPKHFECEKNNWAAHYQGVILDGECIAVPHWFWHDTIMRTGTR